MRKLLLAGAAVLGLAVSAGGANATLSYTIWNDAAVGGGGLLEHDANFPVPTTNLFATFTDTHDTLNFLSPGPFGTSPTFGVFDNGQGILSAHLNAAQLATAMSTADTGSNINTVIRIVEPYTLAAAMTTLMTHDDGAQIIVDGDPSTGAGGTFICGNPAEASVNAQTCVLPAGTHTLILVYAEDNTNPAILQVALPSEAAVPEPASLALLGSALAGLGVFMRRRRKAA